MRLRVLAALLLAVVVAAPLSVAGIWADLIAPEKSAGLGSKGPPPDSSEQKGSVPNVGDWTSTTLSQDPATGKPWTQVSPKETDIYFLRDECLGSKLDQAGATAIIRGYLAEHESELSQPIRKQSPPVSLNCFEDEQGNVRLVIALAGPPIEVQLPDACGDVLEANAATGLVNLELPAGCQLPAIANSVPQMIQVPANVSEVTQR
ncbi:MAG: hypothetical protein ABIP58_07880 [Dehalococcoidia bacterium]